MSNGALSHILRQRNPFEQFAAYSAISVNSGIFRQFCQAFVKEKLCPFRQKFDPNSDRYHIYFIILL